MSSYPSDSDSSELLSARVALENGMEDETINLTLNQSGPLISIQSPYEILLSTIDGLDAPVSFFEEALRTVTYISTNQM